VDYTALATNSTADFSQTSPAISTASSVGVTTLVKPLSEQQLMLLDPLRPEYSVYLRLFARAFTRKNPPIIMPFGFEESQALQAFSFMVRRYITPRERAVL
jgi:hypothetical protein